MMKRRIALAILAGSCLLAAAIAAPQLLGASGQTASGLSVRAIGVVDPAKIQEKFPAYVRLLDLKAAYEKEMKSYRDYLYGQLQSYLTELSKEKEAKCEGKSAAEQKAIEAEYAQKAQARQSEINRQIQAKHEELQKKLDAESAQADAKVKEAIEAVCKEKGIAIVLNKTAVYLGGTDISDAVIAKGQAKK